MAYRNMDGAITIDEDVALSDVRKMAEAEEILRNAAGKLKELISEMQEYQGETVNAILEKSLEMLARIEKLISNLEDTQSFTKRVVAHYQLVDQKCKEALESGGAMGEGSGGGGFR